MPEHSSQLEVHHVDFDRANNDPSNLRTLCANCHTLLHRTHRSRERDGLAAELERLATQLSEVKTGYESASAAVLKEIAEVIGQAKTRGIPASVLCHAAALQLELRRIVLVSLPPPGEQPGAERMKTLPVVQAVCCAPDVEPLDEEVAVDLAARFRALADPTRVAIVNRLARADECCVCNLVAEFELSQPTISHHLKILREAGLVEAERRGTWAYYRLLPEAIGGLRSALGA